jgi:hypothetical protein
MRLAMTMAPWLLRRQQRTSRVDGATVIAAVVSCLLLGSPRGERAVAHAAGLGEICPYLLVIASAETRGELEPCNCPEKPFGGLARRAGLLREVSSSGAPAFVVELGEVFPDSDRMDDPFLWATKLGRAYGEMGYDLVVLGDEDARLGAEVLATFEQAYKEIRPGGGVLVAPPPEDEGFAVLSIVTQRGSMPVLVIAIQPPADLPALRNTMEVLPRDGIPVVAVLHGSCNYAVGLTRALNGADLLVAGDGSAFESLRWIDALPMAGPGIRGRTLAFTRLVPHGDNDWVPASYRLVDVSPRYEADPVVEILLAGLSRDSAHPITIHTSDE